MGVFQYFKICMEFIRIYQPGTTMIYDLHPQSARGVGPSLLIWLTSLLKYNVGAAMPISPVNIILMIICATIETYHHSALQLE